MTKHPKEGLPNPRPRRRVRLILCLLLVVATAGIAWWLTVRHVKTGAPVEAEHPGVPEPLPVFQY